MKHIHLIRHGQSISNAWLPTTDPHSIPLTTLWEQQAQLVADNRTSEPDLIVYSSQHRAYQTALPLMAKYPHVKAIQSALIHEFTYLDENTYKGTTRAERKPHREKFRSNSDIMYKDSPTSESIYDLFTRVEDTIRLLKSRYWKEVAVFSHWQFIYTLKKALQDPTFLTRPDVKELLRQHTVQQHHGINNASIHTITELLS